MVTNLMKVG